MLCTLDRGQSRDLLSCTRSQSVWLHVDRASRGHRDHRRLDRAAAARRAVRARGGSADPVHQQPEADRSGVQNYESANSDLSADDDLGPARPRCARRPGRSSRPGASSPARRRSWSRERSTTRSTSSLHATVPRRTRPSRTHHWPSSTAQATRVRTSTTPPWATRWSRRPATAPAMATGTSGRSTGATPNSVGPQNRSLFGPNYARTIAMVTDGLSNTLMASEGYIGHAQMRSCLTTPTAPSDAAVGTWSPYQRPGPRARPRLPPWPR